MNKAKQLSNRSPNQFNIYLATIEQDLPQQDNATPAGQRYLSYNLLY